MNDEWTKVAKSSNPWPLLIFLYLKLHRICN